MNISKSLTLFVRIIGSAIILTTYAITAPVSLQDAQAVAISWMKQITGQHVRIKPAFRTLSSSPTSAGKSGFHSSACRLIMFEPKGWVIVSSDDQAKPVIAYGTSRVDPFDLPPQFKEWMKGMENEIKAGIKSIRNDSPTNDLSAKNNYLSAQWRDLKNSYIKRDFTSLSSDKGKTSSVRPLLWMNPRGSSMNENQGIIWGQGKYYNDKVPVDPKKADKSDINDSGDHYLAGCIATAMGQVMRYYKQPEHGTSEHSYTDLKSGETLEADFSKIYQWDKMPFFLDKNSGEENISAVATLLADIGVSVEMIYSHDGSSSVYYDKDRPDGASAIKALKKYFGYKKAIYAEKTERNFGEHQLPKTYSRDQWEKLIRKSLESGDPVLYGGYDYWNEEFGGHSFVLDGYKHEKNGYLYHFNWGWKGYLNGYFSLSNMTIKERNNNKYQGNYSFLQRAIFLKGNYGIEPDESVGHYKKEDNVGSNSADNGYLLGLLLPLFGLLILYRREKLIRVSQRA